MRDRFEAREFIFGKEAVKSELRTLTQKLNKIINYSGEINRKTTPEFYHTLDACLGKIIHIWYQNSSASKEPVATSKFTLYMSVLGLSALATTALISAPYLLEDNGYRVNRKAKWIVRQTLEERDFRLALFKLMNSQGCRVTSDQLTVQQARDWLKTVIHSDKNLNDASFSADLQPVRPKANF